TPERSKYLASLTRGFLYRLSSSSTTGSNIEWEGLNPLPVFSNLPTLIGFGIHDHDTFEMACRQANGAIIGTGFIRYLNSVLNQKATKAITKEARYQLIHTLCKNFVGQIRSTRKKNHLEI
ncbi:MAG: tryptophan synthase subunit alpha, partial [Bacteroidales bacterium]